MADQVNYYEVLGVSRNASQSEIRNAYRRLAKERHPDLAGGNEAEFSRLQEAHAVLSDSNRRRQHDQDLDLAHAADQLASLDFGSLDDELSQKRRERESGGETGGPTLGERLRNRFRRKEPEYDEREGRDRSRSPRREARWYSPQDFDPEPVSWRTGALSFFGAFLAFLAVGQVGLWATGANVPPGFMTPWVLVIGPFMWLLYTLAGLFSAYFAYRSAGWAGVAIVFVAALVVGGSGGPERLVQFTTVGIVMLLAVIYLGTRRNRAAWRDRR